MSREFSIEPGSDDIPNEVHLLVHIPEGLRYLEGHFPGDPIVPGIAQLLPLVHDPIRAAWPELGAPRAIRRLKFLGALRPGHSLEVRLVRNDHKVKFEIVRGEQTCTRGTLLFDAT
ncbi:MAG: hypothetical protein AB8I08_38230 [Sandaracinaceae bacterium]